MNLKKIAYAAIVAVAASAFTLASATTGEAKSHKKKEAAKPAQQTAWCVTGGGGPVCATKGNMKFTYANACYAAKDGAKMSKAGACPQKAAKKGGGKKKAAKKSSKKKG